MWKLSTRRRPLQGPSPWLRTFGWTFVSSSNNNPPSAMMWGLRGCGGCSFLCFYLHNPTLHFPARPWCIGLWNRITGWANFTSIKDPIILVSAIRSCVGGALWRLPTLSVAIIFLTWCNYFCWRLTINVTDWLITSWPLVIISSLLLLSNVSWPGLAACTYNAQLAMMSNRLHHLYQVRSHLEHIFW